MDDNSRYFEFIKKRYNMDDEVIDKFDYLINASSLFGIIPGLIIKYLDPKKSAVLGGLLIAAGQMATVLLVTTEHEKIKENPTWVLGSICVLVGQGSCLLLLSVMQALMNLMTIQASHVITTCCFAYYLGADTYIVSVKDGMYKDASFSDFTFTLAMTGFVLSLVNLAVISDEDDVGGFFGKAIALSKGIIYKKTNYGHIFIQFFYMAILFFGYFSGGLKTPTTSYMLYGSVLAHYLIPIIVLCLNDP